MPTTQMLKRYVSKHQQRKEPGGKRLPIDMWFTSEIEEAESAESRPEAAANSWLFNKSDIEIDSSEGGKHTLKNFRFEERRPKEFVIFCEGPFVVEEKSKLITS